MAHRTVSLDESPGDRSATTNHDHVIEILLKVAGSMAAADGVQAALDTLARLGLRAVGADRCAILVPARSGRTSLLPAAAASEVGDPVEQWKRFKAMTPIDVNADPRLAALWNAQRVITLDDAAASDLIPTPWKQVWGSRSLAIAPIRAEGDPYGILVLDYVLGSHRFTPDETKVLEAIASAAGAALRSAELVERLRRSVAVERRLAECLTAVRSGRSLHEVLEVLADRFTSLLEGSMCSINLLTPDRDGFRIVAWRGFVPQEREVPLTVFPARDVERIRTSWRADPRRPILIPNLAVLEEWDGIVPAAVGTGILVPLASGHEILGFVSVGRDGPPFTPDEVRVATAFGDQAGLAVEQARLQEVLRVRLHTIEALQRLSDEVARTSNLRRMLTALNRGIGAEVGVRCVRVAFYDPILATAVGGRTPSAEERRTIKAWRAGKDLSPRRHRAGTFVPVSFGRRVTGGLLIRTRDPQHPAASEFVAALAAGIGEVATKAKLRRTAEGRAKELAIAAERERIARDLHDTVGQTFHAIGLRIHDIARDIDDPDAVARLDELRTLTSQGVLDVRSAVYALSFLHVRERGFVASLRALTERFGKATGVEATLRLDGEIPTLPAGAQSALYRLAHEALVNVERHARATGVVLWLRLRDDEIELTIRDDGVGLDQRHGTDWRIAAHFGMRMMARAVEAEGGRFTARAADPRGLLIRATMPLRERRGA